MCECLGPQWETWIRGLCQRKNQVQDGGMVLLRLLSSKASMRFGVSVMVRLEGLASSDCGELFAVSCRKRRGFLQSAMRMKDFPTSALVLLPFAAHFLNRRYAAAFVVYTPSARRSRRAITIRSGPRWQMKPFSLVRSMN